MSFSGLLKNPLAGSVIAAAMVFGLVGTVANAATWIFDLQTVGSEQTDIDLRATLTVVGGTDVGGGNYSYDINWTNLDLSQEGSNTFTGFALSYIPADATVVSWTTTSGFIQKTNLGSLGDFEFCAKTGTNPSCTGGNATTGTAVGGSGSGTLVLNANVTFDKGWGRWQQVGVNDADSGKAISVCPDGSFGTGDFVNCPPGGGGDVPEMTAAGSVAALGSVFALMAFLFERRGGPAMRRRRRIA